MAIQTSGPTTKENDTTLSIQSDTPLNARDRLLDALKNIPPLSWEDAEAMNRAVQEAREASIAGELSV